MYVHMCVCEQHTKSINEFLLLTHLNSYNNHNVRCTLLMTTLKMPIYAAHDDDFLLLLLLLFIPMSIWRWITWSFLQFIVIIFIVCIIVVAISFIIIVNFIPTCADFLTAFFCYSHTYSLMYVNTLFITFRFLKASVLYSLPLLFISDCVANRAVEFIQWNRTF